MRRFICRHVRNHSTSHRRNKSDQPPRPEDLRNEMFLLLLLQDVYFPYSVRHVRRYATETTRT